MDSTLVEMRDISLILPQKLAQKGTSDQKILDHVSLHLAQNRITTIIGPNGAGKTTLLKILLGFIQPTSGHLYRRPLLKIGYMPQKISISPLLPLTVKRFLELASPEANKELAQKLRTCLEKVGAAALMHSQVAHLSGGELQRILLARALMDNPDLLVLDEPAQGVDVLGQADLYQLIAQIRDEYHCGVVLVSHDLHVVMSASDDVLCLNTHVCCSGHPDIIQQNPAYLTLFGPQKTESMAGLAPYIHHHDHRHDGNCTDGEHHD